LFIHLVKLIFSAVAMDNLCLHVQKSIFKEERRTEGDI